MVQGSPKVAAADRPLELEVTGGPAAGQRFSVHEDFTLGSGEAGPGSLRGDRWLSPAHAVIRRGPEGWAVEDLRSQEGTTVNGRPTRGAVTLSVGDVLDLGSSRIVVLPDPHSSAAAIEAASPEGVGEALRAESRRQLDGKRLLAFVIDALVLAPMAYVVLVALGRGRVLFCAAAAALGLTYYFLCESLTGQTLGKRIAGLKVVRLDGRPLNPGAVAARTVLRLIDQQLGCLVGLLTMILTGGRRQRVGDLAARTAVARASAPGPRPARRGRERFALYAYPAIWIAPAVLLFVLVPDTRVLPCREAGISPTSGTEGSCVHVYTDGSVRVFDVVNAGHTLRTPSYTVRIVDTATKAAPARLAGSPYYRDGWTAVVAFKLAVRNTGKARLQFDPTWQDLVLVAPHSDGVDMVNVPELPPKQRPGFRSFGQGAAIQPGQRRVAWASFAVPPQTVPQLTQAVSALTFLHSASGAGYEHVSEIRLWRVATRAGVKALAGLH